MTHTGTPTAYRGHGIAKILVQVCFFILNLFFFFFISLKISYTIAWFTLLWLLLERSRSLCNFIINLSVNPRKISKSYLKVRRLEWLCTINTCYILLYFQKIFVNHYDFLKNFLNFTGFQRPQNLTVKKYFFIVLPSGFGPHLFSKYVLDSMTLEKWR